ncbi:MAG TPA: hypothetical protein VNU46_05445 [Gemmatimonadaceae bacterium]|jgi:hypothetical protein|nr:hypothetical protein [Gemmatimonadaceae bacterium]
MEHSASLPLMSAQTLGTVLPSTPYEASSSGISWAAVIGGAFVAAALSLILLALGTGLGLSSVSPWSNSGISATTLGMAAIIWLIVAQIMSSAMGGYVAGRLRTKWADLHTDEVYFRDTAHGLLVWAVGVVITAGLLASAATSMAGGGGPRAQGPGMMAGASADAGAMDPNAYFVDALFRSDHPTPDQSDPAVRGEASRILAHALRHRDFVGTDKMYLDALITAKTGITQADADQRVSQVFVQAQQTLDTARKSAAHLSLWIFVALLAGAFCASLAATIGGRQRDHLTAI